VAEYAPNSSVTLTGTGMAGVKVSITLGVTPNGSGSDMTILAAFEGQMLVGAIGAAVEKAGRTELDESTGRLATLVS
jgi:surface antigen